MTFQDDLDIWQIWVQSGTALIDGEWVEGTTLYRHERKPLARFISFTHLESQFKAGAMLDFMKEIPMADFVPDADSRSLAG